MIVQSHLSTINPNQPAWAKPVFDLSRDWPLHELNRKDSKQCKAFSYALDAAIESARRALKSEFEQSGMCLPHEMDELLEQLLNRQQRNSLFPYALNQALRGRKGYAWWLVSEIESMCEPLREWHRPQPRKLHSV